MTVEQAELTPAMEDYLEAVLVLVRQGHVARVRDIARHLDVHMPSVTSALRALSKKGLVNYDPYQVVTLTDHGREVAESISGRHHMLRRFFADVLALPADVAEANACRIEHAADAVLLERLSRFIEFVGRCPRTAEGWVESFASYLSAPIDARRCRRCVEDLRGTSRPPARVTQGEP